MMLGLWLLFCSVTVIRIGYSHPSDSFFSIAVESQEFNFNLSFLNNVYEFENNARQALCTSESTCSINYLFYMKNVFVESLPDSFDKAPVHAMQLFYRQQVVRSMQKSSFNLSLEAFRWQTTKFGVFLNLNAQNLLVENLANFLITGVLSSVSRAVADVAQWAEVYLVLGFVFSEKVDKFYYNVADELCKQLALQLRTISVQCHGFASKSFSPFNDLSFLNFHTLPEGATGDWDARETLCRLALESDQLDYFILLDENVAFTTSTWLLTSLASVAGSNGYFPGMGVGALKCTNTENRSVMHVPRVPVLHRTHFELFQERTLFSLTSTVGMNNMMLMDIYSPFQSERQYCIEHYMHYENLIGTESMIGALTWKEVLMIPEYVSRVEDNRKYLRDHLNKMYYSRNPLNIDDSTLLYNSDGRLFESMGATKAAAAAAATTTASSTVEPKISTNKSTGARIAFITAVFGKFESTLKYFARQFVPTDFICFTDHPESVVNSNGAWIVDATPYHLEALQYEIAHNLTGERNSLHNNQHPFSIAKYYKSNFLRIPRLAQYDVIVWMDGTIEVHNPNTSAIVLDLVENHNQRILIFPDEFKSLKHLVEVAAPLPRYASSFTAGHAQPIQPLQQQYEVYMARGFNDTPEYWQTIAGNRTYGNWITCFIAFAVRKPEVVGFLDLWTEHIRSYSTEDQMSFSFVVQATQVFPYAMPPLPSEGYLTDIVGRFVNANSWFYKHEHNGKKNGN